MDNKRDIQIDNIKGLLIFLVVLGHILSLEFRESNCASEILYSVIYSFHMPCFIFLNGYLVKDKLASKGYYKQTHMLLIYYLFGFLLVMITSSVLSRGMVVYNPFSPPIALWYLLTLFYMRMLAPWLVKVKCIVPVCILVSLVSGLFSFIGSEFSISRTICLLPFFNLGLVISKETVDRIKNATITNKCIIILVSIAVETLFIWALISRGPNFSILWMKGSYASTGIGAVEGGCFRIAIIMIASAVCCVLFSCMTRKQCFLTKWGRNSLAVYLLHTVFYLVLRNNMHFSEGFLLNNASVCIAIAISILVVIVLSADAITDKLNKLLNTIGRITYKL